MNEFTDDQKRSGFISRRVGKPFVGYISMYRIIAPSREIFFYRSLYNACKNMKVSVLLNHYTNLTQPDRLDLYVAASMKIYGKLFERSALKWI